MATSAVSEAMQLPQNVVDPHASPPLDVDSWKNFFLTAGFGETAASFYVDLFQKHEVDLDMLSDVTHEVLAQMGVWKAVIDDALENNSGGFDEDKTNDSHHGIKQRAVAPKHKPTTPGSNQATKKRDIVVVTRKPDATVANNDASVELSSSTSEDDEAHSGAESRPGAKTMPSIPQRASSSSIPIYPGVRTPDSGHRHAHSAPFEDYGNSSDGGTPPNSSFMQMANRSYPLVGEDAYLAENQSLDAYGTTPPGRSVVAMRAVGQSPGTPPTGRSGSMGMHKDGSSSSIGSAGGPGVYKYFLNDEIVKHRVKLPGEMMTLQRLSDVVRSQNKLANDDFAVFTWDPIADRLRIMKDSNSLIHEETVYYVIENNKIDKLIKKVEAKVKKDLSVSMANQSGRPVWNSDNRPMTVDFVPETDIYMSQMGRIGLCMAPGRKKKKAHHEWDRDLDKDLDRIKNAFGCDVFVSLIRHSELVSLKIPNLVEEVERREIESIHFPIKDKWIPNSMEALIGLADTLIQRLKAGKTIIIHCNGGKGRSATVAVAVLIGLGKKVQDAIDVVRKARSGTIRNPLQIIYVKRFKKAWRSFQKKKQKLITGDSITEGDDYSDDTDDDEDAAALEADFQAEYSKHQAQGQLGREDDEEHSAAEEKGIKKSGELNKKRIEEEKKQKKAVEKEEKKRIEEAKEAQKKKEKEEKEAEERRKKDEKKKKEEEEKRKKEEEKLKKEDEKRTAKRDDASVEEPVKPKSVAAEEPKQPLPVEEPTPGSPKKTREEIVEEKRRPKRREEPPSSSTQTNASGGPGNPKPAKRSAAKKKEVPEPIPEEEREAPAPEEEKDKETDSSAPKSSDPSTTSS